MSYQNTEEQKGSFVISVKKTAQTMAVLLGVSFVLAGCGGAGKEAGDSGAANAVESTDAAESAGTEETAVKADTAGEAGDAGEASGNKEAAPADIYKSIEDSVDLPSMVEGDDDFISNYYGIDPANLDSYVFASAEDATLATSVIIMKAKSEDAVDMLVNSLNTVIDQKAAEMQGYIPEQYDVVADSSVKTDGLYVYLVIAENAGDIESVISAALK